MNAALIMFLGFVAATLVRSAEPVERVRSAA